MGEYLQNGLGFPPLLKWPIQREHPWWSARLRGWDRWPNLCAARASRQVLPCVYGLLAHTHTADTPTPDNRPADGTTKHWAWT